VLGTLDFVTLGTFSGAVVEARTFLETEGTFFEKAEAGAEAKREHMVEVATLGFSSAPDRAQHARELSGVAALERGGRAIGTGIGEGDPEKIWSGVAEAAGGTAQVTGLVAGAAETTVLLRGRLAPRMFREGSDGPGMAEGPFDLDREWDPQGYADGLDSLSGQLDTRQTTRRLELDEAPEIGAEIDAAFNSGQARAGTMIQFTDEAGALSGSGPKYGQGDIWYHDNIKIPGVGPDGRPVQLRTHSPNPNAPPKSYSRSHYTTQINTNNGLYLLPDGSWKTISEMTPAERTAAHYPAGN
jgi:hypothetical protein